MISQDELHRLLDYDPDTGIFTWKVSTSNRAPVGSVVRSVAGDGYICASIHGRRYYAHRLAILYMTGKWPPEDVDHINRKKSDNRFCNLRLADRAQNKWNVGKFKNNTSGYKGVRIKRNGRAEAQICIRGKQRYLGLFDTPEDAHAAYVAASKELHGEYGVTT